MIYLYAVLGWIVWCSLHSTLISIPVTEYMKRKLGDGFRFYRLFYNAFSLATLIPLLLYSASIRQEPVFRWEGPLGAIPYLLLVTGIGLFSSAEGITAYSSFWGSPRSKEEQQTVLCRIWQICCLGHPQDDPSSLVPGGHYDRLVRGPEPFNDPEQHGHHFLLHHRDHPRRTEDGTRIRRTIPGIPKECFYVLPLQMVEGQDRR